jgi:hypothetical protein
LNVLIAINYFSHISIISLASGTSHNVIAIYRQRFTATILPLDESMKDSPLLNESDVGPFTKVILFD